MDRFDVLAEQDAPTTERLLVDDGAHYEHLQRSLVRDVLKWGLVETDETLNLDHITGADEREDLGN